MAMAWRREVGVVPRKEETDGKVVGGFGYGP